MPSLPSSEPASRDLLRQMRVRALDPLRGALPEAEIWRIYCELRRRKVEQAGVPFLAALRTLHGRRALGTTASPADDPAPEDHKWVDDPFLGELWRAYKRCIRQGRPGPAQQILHDLERHLGRARAGAGES